LPVSEATVIGVVRAAMVMCAGVGLALSAQAQQLDPLALRNPSALTRLYGIPVAQPAALLPSQASLWQLNTSVANTFSRDSDANEAIFLDGELTQLQLGWRHGVAVGSQALEVYTALEAVHHGGGFLDHSIEQYHSAFGLPQGNRTRFDTNGLRYAYRDGDELQLEFEQGGAALGDLQLGAAYALYQQEQRAVSARLTLKLPTGDADQLAGSGAADLALALHGGMPWWRGQLDAAGGVVLLGDGDVLPRKQRDAAAFGHVAYAYPWTPAVALLAQLGGNTAMYADTSMEALKDSAFLAVGARWQLHPAWALEASLIEDILVNSTADVTFSLGLRYAPARM